MKFERERESLTKAHAKKKKRTFQYKNDTYYK